MVKICSKVWGQILSKLLSTLKNGKRRETVKLKGYFARIYTVGSKFGVTYQFLLKRYYMISLKVNVFMGSYNILNCDAISK